jgi:hypothetical protein
MFTASAYAFNTAKSLEVKDVHSQCGVAALLVESGRTEQALRCLHNVSEIDDDELASAIHHNMGVGKEGKILCGLSCEYSLFVYSSSFGVFL